MAAEFEVAGIADFDENSHGMFTSRVGLPTAISNSSARYWACNATPRGKAGIMALDNEELKQTWMRSLRRVRVVLGYVAFLGMSAVVVHSALKAQVSGQLVMLWVSVGLLALGNAMEHRKQRVSSLCLLIAILLLVGAVLL